MKKINENLLRVIGNYLEIEEFVRLSMTWREYHEVFKDYFEIYKRECTRLFSCNLNLFKNLLMDTKLLSSRQQKKFDPGFLCKGTATKVWVELVNEGMSLKNKWKNSMINFYSFNHDILLWLGDELFQVLKSPDLTVPALLREDNIVDLHSVYSTYLYEYLFRMKNIYSGRKPAAIFTFLSEKAMKINEALGHWLSNVNEIAQEIVSNDEAQIFFNLRWYRGNPSYKLSSRARPLLSKDNCDRPALQFNSYYSSDSDSSTYTSTQFKNQIAEMLRKPDIKSNLNLLLLLIHETVTFHWRMTNEIIIEIEDNTKFLEEYDKRWNAFVASMIKLDDLLTPLSRIVNKVYKRTYPNYPCYPHFSFLRFFIFIWKREVYSVCKESLEDNIVKILKKFHKSWLAYSKEEKQLRKIKKKTSLSDYFNSSVTDNESHSGFRSMISPSISGIKPSAPYSRKSYWNRNMMIQDRQNESYLEIFNHEIDTNLPNFLISDKESFKQILIDVMDLSLNEYSIHYVNHSENTFQSPYKDLRNKVKDELFNFYKSSIESTPFKLWSEIIDEHCRILCTFLPVTLQKELHEYRLNFVKKYTKNRIGFQLKGFSEFSKKAKKSNGKMAAQVFNANAVTYDPTVLTETEYLEITVADYLNTPFYEFLVSSLKKQISRNSILSLLAYIKENEVNIMDVYNSNVEINRKFTSEMESRNAEVQRYKESRGFPLKLDQSDFLLYSIEDGISISLLEKIRIERQSEKERKETLQKDKPEIFSSSFSIDSENEDDEADGCMDVDNGRALNLEKRNSKLDPLCPFNLIREFEQKDVNMEFEESKSGTNEEEKTEVQSISSINSFIKRNVRANKDPFEQSDFQDAMGDVQSSKFERKSNIEKSRYSSLSNNMIRFSDLEKMDEDAEMEEIPERLTFKKT